MSDAPTAPDWWQASDGRWYPPPHPGVAAPGAPTGGSTTTMTMAPPVAATREAPVTGGRSWLVVVVLGAVMVVAGVLVTYMLLSTTIGPAGMCGSVFDSLEVDRLGPCRQLLDSQSLKAGLVGGGLAVVGIITAGAGFVLRSRSRTS